MRKSPDRFTKESLATPEDVTNLRRELDATGTRLVKWGVALTILGVLLNTFLKWVMR